MILLKKAFTCSFPPLLTASTSECLPGLQAHLVLLKTQANEGHISQDIQLPYNNQSTLIQCPPVRILELIFQCSWLQLPEILPAQMSDHFYTGPLGIQKLAWY